MLAGRAARQVQQQDWAARGGGRPVGTPPGMDTWICRYLCRYMSQMLYAGQSAREIVTFFSDF